MKREEKEAGLKELKAQAYDALAQCQQWEARLKMLNEEIAKLVQTPVEDDAIEE